MRIAGISVFVGSNIYAGDNVVRLTVESGAAGAEPPSGLRDRVVDGLLDGLPGLGGAGSGDAATDVFGQAPADDGMFLGRAVAAAARELQRMAGHDSGSGSVRSTENADVCEVILTYEEAKIAVHAGRLALALVDSLLAPELRSPDGVAAGFDFGRARDGFLRDVRARAMGSDTAYLVKAARARGIPWVHMGDNLVQFGQGRYQRRLFHAFTDATGYIGVHLSSNKTKTNRVLRAIGLPVPVQKVAVDPGEATAAAAAIGYPVVVKPLGSDMGRGVSVGLADADSVAAAFGRAHRYNPRVIVESMIVGDDYRLLVVDGRFVAAARRVPGHVVGDGRQTIEMLVAALNRDPRRTPDKSTPLTPIELDAQADQFLVGAGYGRTSVPKKGETVYLRANANLSTGGISIDVTDAVHLGNRELAVRAARAVGVDVAGVDFLTPDISRSYLEVGGGICEVNCTPALYVHYACSEGTPRDVASPIFDMLYPPGMPSRVAIATIAGGAGAEDVASLAARILHGCGQMVGLATGDGLYIGGNKTAAGDMMNVRGARMVLNDPLIDSAVMVISAEAVLRQGLGYDRCAVAVLMDGAAAASEPRGTAEAMTVVLMAADDAVVVNADDETCLKLAGGVDGPRLFYVTGNPGHPLVRDHIDSNGRAVVLEKDGCAAVFDRGERTILVQSGTMAGIDPTELHGVLFSAAIAYSLGRTPREIQNALAGFE